MIQPLTSIAVEGNESLPVLLPVDSTLRFGYNFAIDPPPGRGSAVSLPAKSGLLFFESSNFSLAIQISNRLRGFVNGLALDDDCKGGDIGESVVARITVARWVRSLAAGVGVPDRDDDEVSLVNL